MLASALVSDWIERLRGLVRGDARRERAPDTEQSRRVEAALGDRVLQAGEGPWLDTVERALGDGPVDARSVELIVGATKIPGAAGYYGDLPEDEAAAHLAFWRRLVARQPGDAVLAAHLADAEMVLADPQAGLARFLDTFDRQPELFFEFGWDLEEDAEAAGGDLRFRWQLHQLRWFLGGGTDVPEVGDEARELYGALLDEYRDDPPRLAQLQALGDELRRLETAGDLPRAMVLRQRRRRPEG